MQNSLNMEKNKTADAYYEIKHHFKDAIAHLRSLAKQTEAKETCKWGMPVYTLNGKNVYGICRFKDFFGIWFYQGVFLKDSKKVLRNAQEGKTKAMRHWNFKTIEEIDDKSVMAYLQEAIENQKLGKEMKPSRKSAAFVMPDMLQDAFEKNGTLKKAFYQFSPFKQKEFGEYYRCETRKNQAQKITKNNSFNTRGYWSE